MADHPHRLKQPEVLKLGHWLITNKERIESSKQSDLDRLVNEAAHVVGRPIDRITFVRYIKRAGLETKWQKMAGSVVSNIANKVGLLESQMQSVLSVLVEVEKRLKVIES